MEASFLVETTEPSTLARNIVLIVAALVRARTGCMIATHPPPHVGGYFYFFFGNTTSTSACGRAMTCTLTSSPLMALMACAPASVAALTAATSPTTTAVTSALPTCHIGPA